MAFSLLIPRTVTKTREMFAAGMGGVLGTVADVLVLMALVAGGVSIPVSTFFAATAGAVICFVMNKYVAFRDRSPVTFEQVARFAIVAVTTAVALAVLMEVVAVRVGVPVLPAKLICAAMVFVAWTYPAQRRLVFSRTSAPSGAEAVSPAQSLA